MTNNNDEPRTLNLPADTTLPFFAYGIFKPGQLAYSKIKNYVMESKNAEINYPMKTRDGVPILIDNKRDFYHTNGSLITFRQGQEKMAYEIICKTLLRKLYRWKTVTINERKANVLFAQEPDKGSYAIECPDEQVNYDGKRDPFFKDVLDLIENNLNSKKNLKETERFFDLQMNYMLLWSAIDRFSSLKYNQPSENENRKRFSKQKAFRDGIKKFENEHHRPVYSTDDLEIHDFDTDDPFKTLKYYYTLRCNVVHRGKSMKSDYDMLKQATEELLEIFRDVLESAFRV